MSQLVLELRAPDPPAVFVLDVDPDSWRLESHGDFATAEEVRRLNRTLGALRADLPSGARFFRSFPKFVAKLRDRRTGDGRLALYFRIALPGRTPRSQWQAIAERLAAAGPIVRSVTLAPTTRPAACSAGQGYVKPSSVGGVDAVFAWDPRLPGGRGENVTVCLLDGGYDTEHADLPQIDYILAPLNPDPDHGTLCLGVVLAKPSAPVTGIAYAARGYVSSTTHGDDVEERFENALDAAFGQIGIRFQAGDVFWIPRETKDPGGQPVETIVDVKEAIHHAVDQEGVVVVGAAGNGDYDVNTLLPTILVGNPPTPTLDSKAIMVGAGAWPGTPALPNPHARERVDSNWGLRVDCQGWGEEVCTTQWTYGTFGPYTDDFGGTSAASSMIAGVCAVVQSVQKAAGRPPIPALDLRDKLRDPSLGLPYTGSYPIGPLPDLRRLLRDCDLLPDCFLRDHVGDDGSEPSVDPIWYSPDIVTRVAASADPQGDLGGPLWDQDLNETLARGGQGFLHLRVENRGPFDDEPGIDVYWAYPGSFIRPADWHFIGHVDVPVPAGQRIVTGEIPWTPPADTDHPCLIAVLSSYFDEAPPLVPQSSISDYVAFIQRFNNISHRNVVTAAPAAGDMVFFILDVRWPPFWAWHWIEVLPALPPGSRVFVGLPQGREEAFRSKLRPRSLSDLLADARGGFGGDPLRVEAAIRGAAGDRRRSRVVPRRWIVFDPTDKHGTLRFDAPALEPGEELPLVIGVRLGSRPSRGRPHVAVDQLLYHRDRRGRTRPQRIGRVRLEVGGS